MFGKLGQTNKQKEFEWNEVIRKELESRRYLESQYDIVISDEDKQKPFKDFYDNGIVDAVIRCVEVDGVHPTRACIIVSHVNFLNYTFIGLYFDNYGYKCYPFKSNIDLPSIITNKVITAALSGAAKGSNDIGSKLHITFCTVAKGEELKNLLRIK